MRRARVLLATWLFLTLLPAFGAATHNVRAASRIGSAQTDFTRVTPANAMLFATMQATAGDQLGNLSTIEGAITSQPGFQDLLQAASGRGSNSTGAMARSVLTQAANGLKTLFNGEVGLAVLPATVVTDATGRASPRLHLLFDAGLQPGVSFSELGGALLMLGLSNSPSTAYRNVSIASIDLNTVLRAFHSGGKAHALPAQGPISTVLYMAVIGNDAVLATDLPTMQAAIDVSVDAQPSISANSDYQTDFAALPDSRMATLYLHYDLAAASQLAEALRGGRSIRSVSGRTGTLSQAFAITAKPDGLLFTASPSIRTGSLVKNVSLSPLQNSSAANLPDGALFYAAINDPGDLLKSILTQVTTHGQQSSFPIKPLDPIKVLDKTLGIDLQQDVFSWMHGEASIALLPVGNDAFGGSLPAASRLSLVATLKITDQGTVDQKLQQLDAAIQALSSDPSGLQLVETTGANGSPERILAATPKGIGYTFNNGYLIAATALPADITALQGVSSGSNLSTNALFKAALSYAGPAPYGAVAFIDLSALRQSLEQIAQDKGLDLTRYNHEVRPLLTAFKSLTMVANPGANGGGVLFLGIGH